MKKEFIPVLGCSCVIEKDYAEFYLHNKHLRIDIDGEAIRKIVQLCNGTRNLEEILHETGKFWERGDIERLINELRGCGAIIDGTSYVSNVWQYTHNPSANVPKLDEEMIRAFVREADERDATITPDIALEVKSDSTVSALLKERVSTRTFSEVPLTEDELKQLLWGAYGKTTLGHRTTPSGGALFPLTLSVAIFRQIGDIRPGIYRISSPSPMVVGLSLINDDIYEFMHAFADPLVLDVQGPAAVLVISGVFEESCKKYGNRGVLYTVLEAGHAAQNVHISALALGLSTVEIGGFIEESLNAVLKLPETSTPLTSVFLGHKCEEKERTDPCLTVEWSVMSTEEYRAPFAMAYARVTNGLNKDWSCGRSASPSMAYTKASSEAREWASCGYSEGRTIPATISQLNDTVRPENIVAYQDWQYKESTFPFTPFNPDYIYEWVEGRDERTGSSVMILADQVFYPYTPSYARYTHANSSGVAAHPERTVALQNGVLELVERDSFMICHLNRLITDEILENSLSDNLRNRIDRLKSAGFEIHIKDVSLDLAPSILVFAQSEHHNYTTCSGAANFDPAAAISHALMEVESSVLYRLSHGSSPKIDPNSVNSPEDHDKLYGDPRYFRMADFHKISHKSIAMEEIGKNSCRTWADLLSNLELKGLRLITVPLYLPDELGGNAGLHILRSIIPGLVPISFGYGEEPWGMKRLELYRSERSMRRERSSFPHPYT